MRGRRDEGKKGVSEREREAGMNVSAYLNTMMCSLCSAPKAVGGVLVLPSKSV